MTSLLITLSALAGAAEPDKVALLVGIDAYGSAAEALGESDRKCRPPKVKLGERWSPLTGTHNDVRAMKELLERRGFEVRTLLDCDATGAGIVSAFREHLVDGVDSRDDLALFYYSGHGHRLRDDNGDEIDGLDEALVPYDNRGTVDGFGHLRDDALQELIAELSAKTDHAISILDACNSGTATRGAVRVKGHEIPAGEPLPERKRRKAVADGGGVLAEGVASQAILLTAARAEEPALELDLPGSDGTPVAMGAMTHVLLKMLDQAPDHLTWRGLVDGLRIRMLGLGLDQVPQLEGPSDKRLLDGGFSRAPRTLPVRVTEAGGSEVEVMGGVVHGLALGDEVGLYPRDAAPEALTPEAAVARVALTDVSLAKSSARVTTGAKAVAAARQEGLQGRLLQAATTLFRPRFDLRGLSPADAARLREVLSGLSGVELVGEGEREAATDLVASLEGGQLTFLTGSPPAPVPLPTSRGAAMRPSVAWSADDLGEVVAQAVDLHAMRTRILQIENRDAGTRREVELELVTKGDPDAITRGQAFDLRVHNHSSEPLYVGVVELRTDGGTQLVFPDPTLGEGRDRSFVPAGKHLDIPGFEADEAPGPLGFKLIATEDFVDLFGLERSVKQREDPRPVALRGSASPLQALFDGALTTRGLDQITADAAWGTDYVQARIVE